MQTVFWSATPNKEKKKNKSNVFYAYIFWTFILAYAFLHLYGNIFMIFKLLQVQFSLHFDKAYFFKSDVVREHEQQLGLHGTLQWKAL